MSVPLEGSIGYGARGTRVVVALDEVSRWIARMLLKLIRLL